MCSELIGLWAFVEFWKFNGVNEVVEKLFNKFCVGLSS